jgi:hypothetical protein
VAGGAHDQEDPNAVITELALKAKSEICEKALDMFVSAYGAEAGNLALKILSVGGLYVGGGIAPRILEKLKDGTFMKAFTDKGRLSQLLVNTPVRVILESRTALIGAAAYAEARAAELSGISPRAGSVKFSVACKAVKREGLRREFSGVILDRLAQCLGRFSGAELARGGAEEQGYWSLFAGFEGFLRRAWNHPAIYDGPDGWIAPDGL